MVKTKKATALFLSIAMMFMTIAGCQNWSKTAKGGAIGAGAGGLAGAIIGKAAGSTVKGAIIGAAVGGAAGAAIGNYMDRQAREMREDLENAKVERVGEGIKITFDSGILFDVDSHALRDESKSNLEDLSEILKKYEDTNILYAGHTDNTGSNDYNQQLSEERAKSVASYSSFLGVNSERMTIIGYGEEQPIATNSTTAGRQQNRRVEIAIYANDELKRAAKRGELGEVE
ncbi:OmpA family protein [Aliifodinibius sp. S!AR15-10]|uniref:OmpA family protein n=1 Tax=Aliifodinibius sp. S!AR15-10 TaxID=2950437 RepID=UPI00286465B8|nr:OmpA family protein [Aliifodinibius sp. S!AR15-10]MDR8391326.1 OmpA family protein [Aliifodinibius sp. S!AR15-10]